jgi:hypothetical protein
MYLFVSNKKERERERERRLLFTLLVKTIDIASNVALSFFSGTWKSSTRWEKKDPLSISQFNIRQYKSIIQRDFFCLDEYCYFKKNKFYVHILISTKSNQIFSSFTHLFNINHYDENVIKMVMLLSRLHIHNCTEEFRLTLNEM